MIKTMTLGGRDVQFSTSFAWAFTYRAQFGQDPAKVLIPTFKKVMTDETIAAIEDDDKRQQEQSFALLEELGFTGIVQVAWAMAKLADKNTPVPAEWVESFGDDFPVMDLLDELISEAIISCFSTKKSEAPTPAEQKKKK